MVEDCKESPLSCIGVGFFSIHSNEEIEAADIAYGHNGHQ
jgi:hypothetical protein